MQRVRVLSKQVASEKKMSPQQVAALASSGKSMDVSALVAESKDWSIKHVKNKIVAKPEESYPAEIKLQPDQDGAQAFATISKWPGYKVSPLVDAATIAQELGIAHLYLKDETNRFGMGSFKSLGGSYAVARLVEHRKAAGLPPLTGVTTASAGNHGIGLAWGAKMLGVECHVFLAKAVPESFGEKIRKHGATVHRAGDNYEESCAASRKAAAENGWEVVQDVDTADYTEIPVAIFAGYTVIARELVEQLDKPPTHVLLNTGVGGLACAMASHLWVAYGANRPKFATVEPAVAAGFRLSALKGARTAATKDSFHGNGATTVQVGLDCKEPTPIAWSIMSRASDTFVSVSDEPVEPCKRLLRDVGISAGESAVAGIAAVVAAAPKGGRTDLREALGLDEHSRVVVVVCEGPTKAEEI
jgi:diaminopropionate ammonia-lyase